MRSADLGRLLLLSSIWGLSFIFMRLLAPVLGPVVTADMRLLIAGIVLVLYFAATRYDAEWKKYWKQYLVIGVINSALPFFLFSFAAMHIPAGYSAILNSSSPLFMSIFAALWLGEALTLQKMAGLMLGMMGVALVTKTGSTNADPMFAAAAAACVFAAMCYGVSGIYIRKYAKGIKPMAIAGASQLIAGILMMPLIAISPVIGEITLKVAMYTIVFAIFCSGIAYILYYKLVADVGPTRALTVTFITPVFAMVWGSVLLGEAITPKMIAGGILILVGAALVLKKSRAAAV